MKTIRPAAGSHARAAAWLRRLAGRRVAVIGDAMLDEFLWGDATRISPEAPVPVVLLERRTRSLGGAANVAANIVALGGSATLFSVVGDDDAGDRLRALLVASGVAIGALPRLAGCPTTVKHRIFARNKHLLRFDWENTAAISSATLAELLRGLRAAPFDAVIVSDYAKGCVTPELVRAVARWCARADVPWCVDPKTPTLRYRGATVLKPNLAELGLLAGLPVDSDSAIERAAARVLRLHGAGHLLVTRGRDGMALFTPDSPPIAIVGGARLVADVTGAGDTVAAALGLGLAAGMRVADAAVLANLAAGYVVSQPGTAVATADDVLATLAPA